MRMDALTVLDPMVVHFCTFDESHKLTATPPQSVFVRSWLAYPQGQIFMVGRGVCRWHRSLLPDGTVCGRQVRPQHRRGAPATRGDQ